MSRYCVDLIKLNRTFGFMEHHDDTSANKVLMKCKIKQNLICELDWIST